MTLTYDPTTAAIQNGYVITINNNGLRENVKVENTRQLFREIFYLKDYLIKAFVFVLDFTLHHTVLLQTE